jgi:ribonucleoside-diphosphate reductase beta chain
MSVQRPTRLLDPGLCLTLRPIAYPQFYELYRSSIKNTWTVEEVDFGTDLRDLKGMSAAERHMIQRLVAFFATGDSIVANNLVLNLYKHINAPEARMYLSRQLYEEALHVQFYLTLLDTYVPDPEERNAAFAAVENIPSIRKKAEFCMRWLDSMQRKDQLANADDRRQFLLNLICFAACIEGLFFFGAFAYVYFLRSRGMLHGLAAGTSWVFRHESMHMRFAFDVIEAVRKEEPSLFDAELELQVREMLDEAIECETQFAEDLLAGGIAGLSVRDVRTYLEYCADQRLKTLGMTKRYGAKNPLAFVQEVTNFFERRVSAYQVAVSGKPGLDGHSNGAEVIAVSARHVGFDVIYSGIRLSPDEIVQSAVEEGADLIGASVLSGSHLELADQIMEQLREHKAIDKVRVVFGGIIPQTDFDALHKKGARCLRPPTTA